MVLSLKMELTLQLRRVCVCVCVFIIPVLHPTTNHSPGLDQTYFRFSVHSWCIQLSLFVSCHCGHVIKSV